MKKQLLIFLLVISILGIPLALVFILQTDLFNFSIGEVDSWITFWGSYIGAIIGASVVYFVARIQIKSQYDQQSETLREIEQYIDQPSRIAE